jgi:hypothetical protein
VEKECAGRHTTTTTTTERVKTDTKVAITHKIIDCAGRLHV